MPVTISFAGQKVKIDPAAIAEYMRTPNGPVVRGMLVVGDRVKEVTVASMRSEFPRSFLGPRIVKRVNMAQDGPHVLVGSDKVRTRPHRIDGNPVLVFNWPKAGGVVHFRHVNHPGSNFASYLLGRLRAALAVVRL